MVSVFVVFIIINLTNTMDSVLHAMCQGVHLALDFLLLKNLQPALSASIPELLLQTVSVYVQQGNTLSEEMKCVVPVEFQVVLLVLQLTTASAWHVIMVTLAYL